jgi:hypothetical protein
VIADGLLCGGDPEPPEELVVLIAVAEITGDRGG